MKTALLSLPHGSLGGNRTTALRWAKVLRELGWHVALASKGMQAEAELLIALHAAHTRAEVEELLRAHPAAKLVVACTGTDLYEAREESQALLERAHRVIVLQERMLDELTESQRERARVIYQSAPTLAEAPPPPKDHLRLALIASVRPVKDPLLAVRAVQALPESSKVQLLHLGEAIDDELSEQLERESESCARYEWRGRSSRLEALRLIASSHAVVLPSKSEGGASLITEALAAGTPVLASDAPGNVGVLGDAHPGLFPRGDTAALTALLARIETDGGFLERLRERSAQLAWIASPDRERAAWRELLAELA